MLINSFFTQSAIEYGKNGLMNMLFLIYID